MRAGLYVCVCVCVCLRVCVFSISCEVVEMAPLVERGISVAMVKEC